MKRPELSKKYNSWNRPVGLWRPQQVDYTKENKDPGDIHGRAPTREPRVTVSGSSFDMLEGA